MKMSPIGEIMGRKDMKLYVLSAPLHCKSKTVFLKSKITKNCIKNNYVSQAWWCTSVISAFRMLRQEDHEFKASLSYITSC
jgi:hypothetical protein